jgi:hypothetical protein
MTRLHRIALTLSEKIECAVRALAQQEEHGAITDLSREFNLSRPTVYEVKETTAEVLKAHFEQSEPAGQPVCVVVDAAPLQRAIVALRAMSPNALSAIEDTLPICTLACKPFSPSTLRTPSAWLALSCTRSALCEHAPGSLYHSMSKPATCLARSLGSKTGWAIKPTNCSRLSGHSWKNTIGLPALSRASMPPCVPICMSTRA